MLFTKWRWSNIGCFSKLENRSTMHIRALIPAHKAVIKGETYMSRCLVLKVGSCMLWQFTQTTDWQPKYAIHWTSWMYSSAFSFWENYQTLSKSMKSVRENVIKTVDVTSALLRPSVCECITSRELFIWGGKRGYNLTLSNLYIWALINIWR